MLAQTAAVTLTTATMGIADGAAYRNCPPKQVGTVPTPAVLLIVAALRSEPHVAVLGDAALAYDLGREVRGCACREHGICQQNTGIGTNQARSKYIISRASRVSLRAAACVTGLVISVGMILGQAPGACTADNDIIYGKAAH